MGCSRWHNLILRKAPTKFWCIKRLSSKKVLGQRIRLNRRESKLGIRSGSRLMDITQLMYVSGHLVLITSVLINMVLLSSFKVLKWKLFSSKLSILYGKSSGFKIVSISQCCHCFWQLVARYRTHNSGSGFLIMVIVTLKMTYYGHYDYIKMMWVLMQKYYLIRDSGHGLLFRNPE
jgi:hypothetical protein